MHLREKWYFVYIMTNRSKTLYIGFTSIFLTRVFQHKTGAVKGFTTRYKWTVSFIGKSTRAFIAQLREKSN